MLRVYSDDVSRVPLSGTATASRAGATLSAYNPDPLIGKDAVKLVVLSTVTFTGSGTKSSTFQSYLKALRNGAGNPFNPRVRVTS